MSEQEREDPGIRQRRELARLVKAGVPPHVALSLVKLQRAPGRRG